MKRTNVTYGQLDAVLRSLGFSCRLYKTDPPPTRVYEHQGTNAVIMLPPFPDKDKVLEYHLTMVRVMLDNYGIANPTDFAAELQKAG
jgi:hypothetical protein